MPQCGIQVLTCPGVLHSVQPVPAPPTPYAALPGVNYSTLKFMAKSPRHYWHRVNTPDDSPPKFNVGLAAHTLIWEPGRWSEQYAVWTEGRRAGKAFEDFKSRCVGRRILSQSEYEAATGIAKAVVSHDAASPYLSGYKEAPITWTDAETGVEMKGCPDCVGACLVDLKTTGTFEPRLFANTAARFYYHAQAALYIDGLAANGIEVDPEPVWIVAEATPPHDVMVYRVMEHVVGLGREVYRHWLRELVRCKAKGEWPGMGPGEVAFDLPDWAFSDGDPITLTLDGEAAAV